jgi:hypothetical protein
MTLHDIPLKQMTEKQAAKVAEVPVNCQAVLTKAYTREATMRQAVKAKCQECMGWEDVVASVRNCSSPTCPLLGYRPYQVSRVAVGATRGG